MPDLPRPLLVDTCAAIWLTEDKTVSDMARSAFERAKISAAPIYVSPISAWGVGMLVARGRLKVLVTPERWFARLLAIPEMKLADMSPDVLIASNFLPGTPPRDPSDRIIAATARDLGATLITRDRLLLAYAEQGHIDAVAC